MKLKLLSLFLFPTIICNAQVAIELNLISCANDTGIIEITSGAFYDAYEWYYKPINSTGDYLLIPNATSPNFTFDWANYDQTSIKVKVFYPINDSYYSNDVTLDMSNCGLKTEFFNSQLSEIKISPNPVKNFIILNSSKTFEQIEIYNSMGQRCVFLKNHADNKIDVTSLLSGTYFLKLKTKNEQLNLKFVKS